jgi:hypothetical protein
MHTSTCTRGGTAAAATATSQHRPRPGLVEWGRDRGGKGVKDNRWRRWKAASKHRQRLHKRQGMLGVNTCGAKSERNTSVAPPTSPITPAQGPEAEAAPHSSFTPGADNAKGDAERASSCSRVVSWAFRATSWERTLSASWCVFVGREREQSERGEAWGASGHPAFVCRRHYSKRTLCGPQRWVEPPCASQSGSSLFLQHRGTENMTDH